MLNDDKPLLRFTDDSVIVYGSPWNGKHHLSNNCHAPLKAIVELSRSPVDHIEPLVIADGFEVLMKQVYLPADPANKIRTMGLMKKLLNDVSFYHLGCTMDPGIAVFVRNRIFGEDPQYKEY